MISWKNILDIQRSCGSYKIKKLFTNEHTCVQLFIIRPKFPITNRKIQTPNQKQHKSSRKNIEIGNFQHDGIAVKTNGGRDINKLVLVAACLCLPCFRIFVVIIQRPNTAHPGVRKQGPALRKYIWTPSKKCSRKTTLTDGVYPFSSRIDLQHNGKWCIPWRRINSNALWRVLN